MTTQYQRENLDSRIEREHSEFYHNLRNLDRRSFLKVASASFSAAAALGITAGSAFQSIQVASADENKGAGKSGFNIAYISDSHLYEQKKNDRFANALYRAVEEVNNLPEQPEFVFYGGDLAQLGQPEEIQLGYEILRELKAPLKIIPGEHDWYFDMGEKWKSLFGSPNWSFDYKGVHFVSLMSVVEEDFWTAKNMSPLERMTTVAGLDNHGQRPFTVGPEQREWLKKHLENYTPETPVIVFSHSPLYKLYKNWNFWTDDADEVQAILNRFKNVTVIHGHTHQLLSNRIGNIDFHGVLSTAWPWPYPPKGLPELTIPMNRPDPFSPADGCGIGELRVSADGLVDKVYKLWNRKPMFVSAAYLHSGGEKDKPVLPNLPPY
ncbi:MAG: metallophosphoesterase family protein [Thermoguttaceae bacterium]